MVKLGLWCRFNFYLRSYPTPYYGTGFATKEGDSTATAIYLHVEQENKYFKEQLKTYWGEYKQAPIDCNTKSESAVNINLSNHDTSLSTRKPAQILRSNRLSAFLRLTVALGKPLHSVEFYCIFGTKLFHCGKYHYKSIKTGDLPANNLYLTWLFLFKWIKWGKILTHWTGPERNTGFQIQIKYFFLYTSKSCASTGTIQEALPSSLLVLLLVSLG